MICGGYLVRGRRVLLVHHNRFNLWVPPGGHVEAGELFHETAEREFCEETGIPVKAVSASKFAFNDHNASAVPIPFYCDVEREGFDVPVVAQFFWMIETQINSRLKPQNTEVYDARFFTVDEIATLETFEQVRQLSSFAIDNYPC